MSKDKIIRLQPADHSINSVKKLMTDLEKFLDQYESEHGPDADMRKVFLGREDEIPSKRRKIKRFPKLGD